jgi:hypothetical protein
MRATSILVVAFLLVAPRARAQTAENTRQACADGVDNDGDGHVDCADQDCWDLVQCAQAPPAAAAPRRTGYTKVVLGAVLLPLGLVLAGVSAASWVAYTEAGAGSESSRASFGGSVALDVAGLAAIAAGTGLLAVGVGQAAGTRERRAWLAPTFHATSQAAWMGLSGAF